jgi:hypothetical protein
MKEFLENESSIEVEPLIFEDQQPPLQRLTSVVQRLISKGSRLYEAWQARKEFEPTRTFGAVGPLEHAETATVSDAQLRAQAILEEVMATDPRPNGKLPPLYSRSKRD